MLYQIRKIRIAGTFKGRNQLIKGNFESIEKAGRYLIENSTQLFGSNIGLSHSDVGFVLTDLTTGDTIPPVIFVPGDTSIHDGDDVFEITSQSISL